MSDFILEMKDICKSFNGVQVLNNINFSVQRGHIHGLAGCNGAGKSCLMKILTGVYSKDSGEILIGGDECAFNSYVEATARGIRMIFQELSMVPTLTVAENIFLNHEIKRGSLLDEKAMNTRTQNLMQDFEITIPYNAVTGDLSVGQQQLVEIVKAISETAKIVIMDEPTSSLSDTEVQHLFKLMRRLKDEGVAIIYISHRMSEMMQICDDVTIMRNGQAVATKSIADTSIKEIVTCMLGAREAAAFEYKERPKKFGDEVMLSVKHLSVDDLVKDVSFDVKKGEVLGLAGLMGSGRTEILESLFGIRKAQSGQIELEGKPIEIHSPKDAIKASICLTPEDRKRKGLITSHTIKDNIQLTVFDQIKSGILLNFKKLDEICKKDIEDYGVVTDSVNKTIDFLSGGNQQKIVIAKWINRSPKVLLMDEPTVGVDVGAKGEIINMITQYVARGNSLIIVSSEMEEMMAVCDRIIILHDGVVTGELDRKDIENEGVLQNAIQKSC